MNALKIAAAARKALIAADPHYYSWPAQQQEIYRATMDEAAQNRVDAVLLNDLLGLSCTAVNAGEIWRDLPLSKLDNLNWAKLLTTGIGDDMIFLNESMAENTSLLDFETLYDYDFDRHLFQEKANKKEFKNYEGLDYYALRFLCWARLIIDNRFYYSTLFSLAGYLTMQSQDKGNDIIRILIPHQYIDGNDRGKAEKGGFLWDIKINANGLEKQLEELNSRWYEYIQQRWLELSQAFAQDEPAVFMVDQNQSRELHRNFIFNNAGALKKVRWRHFLADCNRIEANRAKVCEMENKELAVAKSWLQKTHDDIMKNFDPKVITFKKKMKIVVAPGAFDGISDKDEEE